MGEDGMIPVSTTYVRTWRKDSEVASTEDPWDNGYPDDVTAAFAVLDEGIRAVVALGNGRTDGPGDSEAVTFNLLADPCDLQYLDEVEDEITGQRYAVEWVVHNPGVGGILASTRAGLSTRKGT